MNQLHFIFMIFLFGFTACGQQVQSDDAILLDISTSEDFLTKFPKSRIISFNDVANGNIPGTITRCSLSNDTLYVLDPYKSKSFFAFDKNGNKLFEYSKIGQAEEEYLFLRDFCFDDKYIYLLDSDSHKILVLDKSGLYKSKIDVPAHVAHFLALSPFKSKNTEFLFDMYACEKAMLLKMIGDNKPDTLMLTPEGLDMYLYLPLNVFQKTEDSDSDILYMPSYSSTIYKLSDNRNLTNYLNIDFNGLLPDSDFFKSLKGLKYKDKEKKIMEHAYDFGFFYSNGKIIISFFYDDMLYLNFIDETNDEKSVCTYKLPSKFYPVMFADNEVYFISTEDDDITVINVSESV